MKIVKRRTEPLWSSLKKVWRSYKILKNKKYVHHKAKKLVKMAKRIRSIQEKLGLPKSQFPELGLID